MRVVDLSGLIHVVVHVQGGLDCTAGLYKLHSSEGVLGLHTTKRGPKVLSTGILHRPWTLVASCFVGYANVEQQLLLWTDRL